MEQKFKQFLMKYNGQFVEVVDPSNLNQCFDLALKWTEWLGLPLNIFSGLLYAYQIWNPSTAIAANNFEYILNSTDAIPQVGDMVIWSKSYGSAGHVAICNGESKVENKTTDWFRAFSQNDPMGSPCVIKTYSFNSVLGWLRFKGQLPVTTDPLAECLAQHTKLVDECNLLKKQLTEKDVLVSNLTNSLIKCQSERDGALKTAENFEEELKAKEVLREKWYGLYQQSQSNLDSCQKDRIAFQKQLTECLGRESEITWGELILRIWNKIRGVKI